VISNRATRLIENFLIVAGIGLLGYVGAMHGYRKAYQAYLSWTFEPDVPVMPKVWPPARLGEGTPVGKLEIPRLNLSVIVLEGVSDGILEKGAGHIPETALPGKVGNVGIAAHRDTFFRPLHTIQNNDLIRLTTSEGVFDYAVEWVRIVKPSAVEVLRPTNRPTLTLVTCYPFYFVGSAPERFIVRAQLIDEESVVKPSVRRGVAFQASCKKKDRLSNPGSAGPRKAPITATVDLPAIASSTLLKNPNSLYDGSSRIGDSLR
jgi:sortase A